jgi:serine/threonine-protein kinase
VIGRVLGGKVEIVERIASGGMGDVYRGKQLGTGADVAVKVLEPATQPDLEAASRFRAEAHVSALLKHRSIVQVFDLLEEDDGTLALVMELLTGMTLEDKLTRCGPLDAEHAIAIIVPILSALEHAHSVGVVHRDVKPANVFLAVEPDGRVIPKLLDFGVAKFEASTVKTLDGNVLGTSRYMSPEQVRAEKLDGRSDLFSVSALLYEAMTGVAPFAAPHAAAALAKVLELTVDADERIPPRVWLVLQKSLSKQAYARHTTASALATALLASIGKSEDQLAGLLMDQRPPLPRLETPATWSTTQPRKTRSRALAVAATGVAAAVVAATIGVAVVGRHEPPAPAAAAVIPPPAEKTVEPVAAIALPVAPAATTASASPLPAVVRPVSSHRPKPIATTPGF